VCILDSLSLVSGARGQFRESSLAKADEATATFHFRLRRTAELSVLFSWIALIEMMLTVELSGWFYGFSLKVM